MKSTYYLSPIGLIQLQGSETYITHIQFTADKINNQSIEAASQTWELGKQAIQQLSEYFAGKRTEFTLPLHPQGTDFQLRVWKNLQKIPYGKTRSYGEIALQIDNPKAARAVGLANNRNPIAIVIPCHRVIGANGNLTGYAGGIESKAFLLNLEQKSV